MELRELALTTCLADLSAKTLIEFTDGVAVLARTIEPGSATVRLSLHLADGNQARSPEVRDDRQVGEVVATLLGKAPLRAFQLPPGTVEVTRPSVSPVPRVALWIGTALVVLGDLIAQIHEILAWYLVIGMLLAASVWWWRRRMLRPVAHFVMRRTPYRFDELCPTTSDDLGPHQIVEDVKAEYGRLLSDLPYRIAHPALFDVREPTTEKLTLALFEWDAAYVARTSVETRDLAIRIRAAFAAAREHAERRGMDHYPPAVRAQAATALGTARLATSESTTPGEREVAATRTIALLEAMALYYLPTASQTRRAIEGEQLRQLPGRPT